MKKFPTLFDTKQFYLLMHIDDTSEATNMLKHTQGTTNRNEVRNSYLAFQEFFHLFFEILQQTIT